MGRRTMAVRPGEKETQKCRKILADLLTRPENRECADCLAIAPKYASVTFGVFICDDCYGVHCKMGDLSAVKPVDKQGVDWKLPETEIFIAGDNDQYNADLEARLPERERRMRFKGFTTAANRDTFIRKKYEQQIWRNEQPPSESESESESEPESEEEEVVEEKPKEKKKKAKKKAKEPEPEPESEEEEAWRRSRRRRRRRPRRRRS